MNSKHLHWMLPTSVIAMLGPRVGEDMRIIIIIIQWTVDVTI